MYNNSSQNYYYYIVHIIISDQKWSKMALFDIPEYIMVFLDMKGRMLQVCKVADTPFYIQGDNISNAYFEFVTQFQL